VTAARRFITAQKVIPTMMEPYKGNGVDHVSQQYIKT